MKPWSGGDELDPDWINMMMIVVVILTAVMIVIAVKIVIVVVIVTAVMAMKTPAILKMRPLWKIGRAHFWHCVYMSVFTKRNIHCINCIYTPYSIYACINIQCTQ